MIDKYQFKISGQNNGVIFIYFNGMNTHSQYYNYSEKIHNEQLHLQYNGFMDRISKISALITFEPPEYRIQLLQEEMLYPQIKYSNYKENKRDLFTKKEFYQFYSEYMQYGYKLQCKYLYQFLQAQYPDVSSIPIILIGHSIGYFHSLVFNDVFGHKLNIDSIINIDGSNKVENFIQRLYKGIQLDDNELLDKLYRCYRKLDTKPFRDIVKKVCADNIHQIPDKYTCKVICFWSVYTEGKDTVDSNISVYQYHKDLQRNNPDLYSPIFLYDKGHFLTWECSDIIIQQIVEQSSRYIRERRLKKKIEKK